MRISTSSQVKSVRFSATSQLRYINHPSREDKCAMWFSIADTERFQHAMAKDAIFCSNVLANANNIKNQVIAKDFLICCIGLDRLILRDEPQRSVGIITRRKEHSRIVLQEQERQNKNEMNSPEDLACVSKASSERSLARARKIGKLVAMI
ncbi:hypothetical protein ACHAW6_002585 [Cyclotella cf. meneghiniana]